MNNNSIDTTESGRCFEREVFATGRCLPCPWRWQTGRASVSDGLAEPPHFQLNVSCGCP